MKVLYIVVIIVLLIILCTGKSKEHAGNVPNIVTPNEAIQTLASMYNNQTVITSKLQLGNKWLLSGVGDKYGDNDWLRLMDKDNTDYSGGLASSKMWVSNPNQFFFGNGGTLQNLIDDIADLKANAIRKDRNYYIQSARDGNDKRGWVLSGGNNWAQAPTQNNAWEIMRIVPSDLRSGKWD